MHFLIRVLDCERPAENDKEMNRALGHFCAHTGYIGPEEPPEDGEMSEMTLPS